MRKTSRRFYCPRRRAAGRRGRLCVGRGSAGRDIRMADRSDSGLPALVPPSTAVDFGDRPMPPGALVAKIRRFKWQSGGMTVRSSGQLSRRKPRGDVLSLKSICPPGPTIHTGVDCRTNICDANHHAHQHKFLSRSSPYMPPDRRGQFVLRYHSGTSQG